MTSSDERNKRFQYLAKMPPIAGIDHRFLLDENGRNPLLESRSREHRRIIKADIRRLTQEYRRILTACSRSGAGYPADQLLRQLSIEYTHRYASSGYYNQPMSFNYFEPFCHIRLIENSAAPYTCPVSEADHIFGIADYFDYLTRPKLDEFNVPNLMALPEAKAFHFTPTGDIGDFTFLTASGREFLVGGFSMVRRGTSLHWYLIGGEVFPEAEWKRLGDEPLEPSPEFIVPHKRPFISEITKDRGNTPGSPIALEGTSTAMKTIVSGETDLVTCKHVGRCVMSEHDNAFLMVCDDPDLFAHVQDAERRKEAVRDIYDRVEHAAVMWNLAEAMFRLPAYFEFKFRVARDVAVADGRKLVKVPKGGRGPRGNFRYVSAIELGATEAPVVCSYSASPYLIETEGYWRRLAKEEFGQDRDGKLIQGKTWIQENISWRQRKDAPKTIYIKSSIAAAKVRIDEYLSKANGIEENKRAKESPSGSDEGVLYVLRCTVMQTEVYKVGWTSGTAEGRARQLSSATGVPSSFAVVTYWKHAEPDALEKGVHAMLAPYRVNDAREFFQIKYSTLKAIIEKEIQRFQPLYTS